MPHEEGYVESAQEIYDREYPEGSLKRQEHEREIERLNRQTEVPEGVWRSEQFARDQPQNGGRIGG